MVIVLKKLVLLLVFILLFSSIVSAVNFEVGIEPLKDTIFEGETAVYKIVVKNRESNPVRIKIESPDVITGKWLIVTSPISELEFMMSGGESKTLEIYVKPIGSNLIYGQNKMSLIFKAENIISKGESIILKDLNVNLQSPDVYAATFMPRVSPTPELPSEIDPLQKFELRLNLENMNALDLAKLEVRLSSELFNAKQSTSLKPNVKQTIIF